MNTILVVDDTKTNINILLELLGDDYDLLAALDGKTAFDILEDEIVDLILLDIMMPDMDGYEVCKRLKNNPKTKSIPVIFITAKTDEDSIEKAYDVGGRDYVTKPFKAKELLARVKTQLQIQKLILNLEQSKEELKLLASIDPLTKLYNRRYFGQISEHILQLAKRESTQTSLFMLDIDKFKNINDTYGHQIGDEVIVTLANTLKKYTRKSDIVCRFGGEEFLVLLPETSLDEAITIAQKIRMIIENLELSFEGIECLKFTVSIGVSSVDLQNDKNIEHAISLCDAALYEAKATGRNNTKSK